MLAPVPSNPGIAASVTALLRISHGGTAGPQLTFRSSGDSYRSTSTGTPRICSRAFRNSISDNVPTRPSWLSSPTSSRARDNEAAETSRKTFKAGTRLGTEPTNRSLADPCAASRAPERHQALVPDQRVRTGKCHRTRKRTPSPTTTHREG